MPGICASSSSKVTGSRFSLARLSAARAVQPLSTDGGPHAPLSQRSLQDAPVGGIVVDHQHVNTLEREVIVALLAGSLVRQLKEAGEMERAALARFALDPDAAAHHLYKRGRNGESQAGAAVFSPRRSVRLREGFKDELLLVLGNSDARS